ncbi:hypothetical protein EXIGLDRAFT_773379 [Exidia glandulosa HHB12029]|uniref:Bacterial surface antigen (D15) domain-containing protein n=1 Tax=Exidia glandulosa HHB12029 TaxID=1314781 RepID=A0A165EUV9_EXIGL|nr:hypothetical protein EXIGLDRAFT_773379 [Exidia glandulosa HHB12029]
MDDDDENLLSGPAPLRAPLANTSSPRDAEPEDDIEVLLRWQEDRMKRRLAGEYESAVVRIAELVNGNLDAPARISAVRVLGATTTRPGFLHALIAPHLGEQATFGDALHATRGIVESLARTDAFTGVAPTLALATSPLAKPGDLDVLLHVREHSRFYFRTATELGDGEGSASATGRIRNVFGGAETLAASVSFGTKTRHSFTATFAAPIVTGKHLNTRAELQVYGSHLDNESWASSSEEIEGVKTAIRRDTPWGTHEFAYELAQRHICGLLPSASLSMREQARDTTKSALSHTFVHDSRVESSAGRLGPYLKLSQELAGVALGGDAAHLKGEAHASFSGRFFPGTTLSLSTRAGLLYPLAPSRQTLFSDRFQLGGPLSVRSMRWNGLGARDGPDSLGGDLYWAAGVSLIGDIPRKPHWPLKTHAWVNAGRLDGLDLARRPLADQIRATLASPSVTAGVGLIFNHGLARAEINFGVPLVAAKSDRVVKGLQVGVGLEFL